jgi:hypothetical protein
MLFPVTTRCHPGHCEVPRLAPDQLVTVEIACNGGRYKRVCELFLFACEIRGLAMDIKQTMIEAYRLGLRFEATGCPDPDCLNCDGPAVQVSGADERPSIELLDAIACHAAEITALLTVEVDRETRH